FRLIMVTNQPEIARGNAQRETVDRINDHIRRTLALDAVEMCAHDDADGCGCRKPRPGMILRAAERDGISLSDSFVIGDRWRDIEAGRRSGCRTVLIGNGYAEGVKSPPSIAVRNLTEAAGWILAQSTERRARSVKSISQLKVHIFADGADKAGMLEMYAKPVIKGFTTNPTLMRKAGVSDYEAFARDIVSAIPDRPISFEVFADEFDEMERQARRIT